VSGSEVRLYSASTRLPVRVRSDGAVDACGDFDDPLGLPSSSTLDMMHDIISLTIHNITRNHKQWRSQGLEVGGHRRSGGRKSGPSGVQGMSQICIYNLQWTNAFS